MTRDTRLTPAQAAQHGLPPIGFSFKTSSAFLGLEFPAPNTYVTLSGPPGGVLGFTVEAYTDTNASLETLVQTRLQSRSPLLLGQPQQVDLAGAPRDCLGCIAGMSLARSEYCVVRIPVPAVGAGLLVYFILGALNTPGPDARGLVEQTVFADITRTFRIET